MRNWFEVEADTEAKLLDSTMEKIEVKEIVQDTKKFILKLGNKQLVHLNRFHIIKEYAEEESTAPKDITVLLAIIDG